MADAGNLDKGSEAETTFEATTKFVTILCGVSSS